MEELDGSRSNRPQGNTKRQTGSVGIEKGRETHSLVNLRLDRKERGERERTKRRKPKPQAGGSWDGG